MRAIRLIGILLVLGGGVAAIFPMTAAVAANKAADLVFDETADAGNLDLEAVKAEVWRGHEYNTPGEADAEATAIAKLDGHLPLFRNEAFIATSRQETRTQFRVLGIELQVLGLLFILLGVVGLIEDNKAVKPATVPATPAAPAPPATTPATTTLSAPASTPAVTPATTPATTTPPAAPATPTNALLTVSLTRSNGETETVAVGGQKLAEADWVVISIMKTISIELRG